jgi:RNA polymerase sigma-70 factor (ECF subfamily)
MEALETVLNDELRERLLELWERTGDEGLRRLSEGRAPIVGDDRALETLDPQEQSDWISTALMACFQRGGDRQVFALLYERNARSFLQAIQAKLRRSVSRVDAGDVLQEVFLNIYRYPNKFDASRADAFRNWGHRIARNTLLKFLKRETRRARVQYLDEDLGARPDEEARAPLRSAQDAESAQVVDRAYVLYLTLYLANFRQLAEREQRALVMVEVEGRSYKSAAAELGIRLENLKMVVFRGRRKLLRGMHQSLTHLLALRDLARRDRSLSHRPSPRHDAASR